VWTYEAPLPGVAAIKDYLAFYPKRVDRIEELPGDLQQVTSQGS
jgi:uncharacterized protein (DUF427 family)